MAIPFFPASNGQIIQANHVDLLATNTAWFGGTDTGSSNSYIVDFTGTAANLNGLTALASGQMINFVPSNSNTAAATLMVNGASGNAFTHPITKAGGVALAAGDILGGHMVSVIFNSGTNSFEMVNSPSSSGGGGSGAMGATGAMVRLEHQARLDLREQQETIAPWLALRDQQVQPALLALREATAPWPDLQEHQARPGRLARRAVTAPWLALLDHQEQPGQLAPQEITAP
jgi:hypothetical protein